MRRERGIEAMGGISAPLSRAVGFRAADLEGRVRLVTVGPIHATDIRHDAMLHVTRERAYIENGRSDGDAEARGGQGIGCERGELPLQSGAVMPVGSENAEDRAARDANVVVQLLSAQPTADLLRKIRRLQHNGLPLDVAYLSDEQGGSAESGPLALKEWGRRDALNGDHAAGGRDGRSGAAIQHRREVPGRGSRALALPGEGAAAPLALDLALRLRRARAR